MSDNRIIWGNAVGYNLHKKTINIWFRNPAKWFRQDGKFFPCHLAKEEQRFNWIGKFGLTYIKAEKLICLITYDKHKVEIFNSVTTLILRSRKRSVLSAEFFISRVLFPALLDALTIRRKTIRPRSKK